MNSNFQILSFHVYSIKSPPDFKRKMTLLLPVTYCAIPVDSVTYLIFEPVKISRTYVT